MERRFRRAVLGLTVAGLLLLAGFGAAPAGALPASFGSEGSGAGQISDEPAGIAIEQEGGDVYIADRNNNRIDKFDANGKFLLAWGWAVADGSTEALQTCTTLCFGGNLPPFKGSGTGQFFRAEGIAIDNDPLSASHGDVYVVDAENRRIQKFGPGGEFLLMFGRDVNAGNGSDICRAGEECKEGTTGDGPGQFEGLNGRSIAVDSEGHVFVGDENRVQQFSPEGAVEAQIALPGLGFIENLAIDPSKDLYIKSSALPGVREYDQTGTELPPPRDETAQPEANALTIGPGGDLFVNDLQESGRHHIFTFDPTGTQLASFDAAGEAQDAGKHGLAYGEASGALYVANKGTVRVVVPPPSGPLVLAGSELASDIQPTTATLGAMVNPEGPEVTSYHFEYGTTDSYGESTSSEPLLGAAFEDQPANAPIVGLQPRTTYHFRVVVTNAAAETTAGPDETFTTLPPVSIDGTSASQVNATSARLEATLNPHGLPTEYHFEYGRDTSYGATAPTPDASAGSGTVDVTRSTLIQELLPSTTYHYRVVANNSLGIVIGPDRSLTTQGASSSLPDGRAWELVSSPNKHGSPLEPITEEGGAIEAAAQGGGIAYVALGPTGSEPMGVRSPHDSQLISQRSTEGWSTQDVTTRHEEISKIHPGFPAEYKFFSESLSASLVEPEGITPLSPDTTERTPYQREVDGKFVPLVTSSNVLPGAKFGGEEIENTFGQSGLWANGVQFRTATPDLGHILLSSPQVLAPGFAPGFIPEGQPNLYELSGGALRLVSVLPSGKPVSEEDLSTGTGDNDLNMRGAISNDGDRVMFSAGGHLYLRDLDLGRTLQLDQRQPGAPGGAAAGIFQIASSDGSKIFFTDEAQLTTNATAQPNRPDLYMCEVARGAGPLSCVLSDLTVDHNEGESADVRGEVVGVDSAGDRVYFAANGVLTSDANASGEHAVPGNCASEGEADCNLYEYDTDSHRTSLVAVLSSHDDPDWAEATLHVLGNLTARVSPNGQYMTFMSQRSLTGYDNRDVSSGQPDAEVYLLDANSGALHCVSCDPTGARPQGILDNVPFPGLLVDHPHSWRGRWLAGSIPGWTLVPNLNLALYQSRYLSNSGRLFFNASDALVPQDTNNVEDVYEYEPPGIGDCSSSSKTFSPASGGCVALISSGSSKEESAFLDASESGDEVSS